MMTDKKLYLEEKKEGYSTKKLKNLNIKPNNQSADFISPPFAIGCEVACSYCILGESLILTPSGEIPIKEIKDGDKVLSYNILNKKIEEAYVQSIASREVEELVEIEVEGKSICVSLEHPFYTTRGWVEAQYLTTEDELITI